MSSQALPVRKYFATGFILLAVAVLIGAFGAHGLKALVTAEKLVIFETGVRYHFFHGFGILAVAFMQKLYPEMKLTGAFYAFVVGILLFSFNCYFYVLSDMKVFAMIVPVGGLLFMVGWIVLFWKSLKLR